MAMDDGSKIFQQIQKEWSAMNDLEVTSCASPSKEQYLAGTHGCDENLKIQICACDTTTTTTTTVLCGTSKDIWHCWVGCWSETKRNHQVTPWESVKHPDSIACKEKCPQKCA